MYSPLQRLRSLRHRFWYGVSERLAWSRGTYRERAAMGLPSLPVAQARTVAGLSERYAVRFEDSLNAATSLNNYEYLELLDRFWAEANLPTCAGGDLCDVGCASFWYAATLHAFFRPRSLTGIDIEGHRLFKDGRTRIDYASGYVAAVPGARFSVADYRGLDLPSDVITTFFPFVTAPSVLAWRLPLTLLDPNRLIQRIYHNLRPGGVFIMVNHGIRESQIASACCDAAGLRLIGRLVPSVVLGSNRLQPAVLSCWTRYGTNNRTNQ